MSQQIKSQSESPDIGRAAVWDDVSGFFAFGDTKSGFFQFPWHNGSASMTNLRKNSFVAATAILTFYVIYQTWKIKRLRKEPFSCAEERLYIFQVDETDLLEKLTFLFCWNRSIWRFKAILILLFKELMLVFLTFRLQPRAFSSLIPPPPQ